MNSNEEYLDSLLKSIEEKEANLPNEFTETMPVDLFVEQSEGALVEESVVNSESEFVENLIEEPIAGFEVEPVTDHVEEPMIGFEAEPIADFIEEPIAGFEAEPVADFTEEPIVDFVEEPVMDEPEIVVQSGDTLLDILKNNPDRVLSPEQIENMFAHAEEENNASETAELIADEPVDFGMEDLFGSATVDVSEPVSGDTLFTDDVQNMAEDEIMRLLQQSSDVSQESDGDGMNLDFLFDDMSGDANLAEIEAMIDKAENNEPVSSEVEEMIQLGLKVDAGEMPMALPPASPKVIIGKIKDGFANIFKKEKGEKEDRKKEKKEKKNKGKKSLFYRKSKKNKQTDFDQMQIPGWDSLSVGSDAPLQDNAPNMSYVPLWDNVQDTSDIPLWDNAQDISDVPAMEETEELDDLAMMRKMMAKVEAEAGETPKQDNNNSFFDQLFGNNTSETSDIPLWDNVQDESDIPLWDNEQDVPEMPMVDEAAGGTEELDEFAMMEKLMASAEAEATPKENVDTSFFDQLFADDSTVVAESVGQEEFGGFVEGLFEQEPEVQMNNNDASEISDLLNSLENAETEAELNAVNDDLFAGMDQEGEVDLDDVEGLGIIRDKDAETPGKKEKKPGFFKRLFTLLTEEDEDPDEIQVNAEGVDELGATSEENKEAMAQLDKEGSDDKKKKKKGKKGKKGEKEDSEAKNGEDGDEDEAPVEDKKKKKKPKKEKKQKEPKFYDDSPKLSKKKVKATVLACISVAAAILVGSLFIPELFELRSARNAFYDGDYTTSYKALYGKKLSDSDKIIFEQSEFLLSLQRRAESYDNYMAIGDELRAVESLILETAKQDDILVQAEKYGLEEEADISYQALLQILQEKYGVTEKEALKISAYRQDALFTLHIKAIVAGEEFVCPEYLIEYAPVDVDVQKDEIIEEILEDILPEEEELTEAEFEEGTN